MDVHPFTSLWKVESCCPLLKSHDFIELLKAYVFFVLTSKSIFLYFLLSFEVLFLVLTFFLAKFASATIQKTHTRIGKYNMSLCEFVFPLKKVWVLLRRP